MTCPLCNVTDYFYKNSLFSLIFVDDIPGYIRLITNAHVKEFSDLSDQEAVEITLAVKKIEKILLKHTNADKINIASLGNMVPHLHIHIIPRFKNDPWWPGATFCEKTRDFTYPQIDLEKIKEEIIKSLG
ncbi:HIT family protein [Caminibacter pacificus]|jgi:diadenosine tetraphosphate (Ap4A) HIT family hydrolase|uniref:Diadenosine tetraphosphate (Ap4A) HIT family hydrolase n=1 Tax=Caminibacter pacificus TaxID=1424653 RepID=A0AAJ4RB02_9BACT|nr:HIT family protein [Caminibacter pacificus]NPA88246.1 HIT family protein [Campylobacterota bacterium]QCI27457.1 HIT family protein [Caminibacter pacificus]ROR38894.1 diadenosine tetraphosphate (Ap4A) HIT family hydrolase [Caminibacter pacificus]